MIYCGADNLTKISLIQKKIKENNCTKIFVVGEDFDFDFGIPIDVVSFQDCIKYVHFYRFLGGIDANSLFIMNEAMQSNNRYILNYNCIRRYARQTSHRLIFQGLPLIDDRKDFMILWDMIQPNPFMKEAYDDIDKFSFVTFYDINPKIEIVENKLNENQMEKYFSFKEECISVATEKRKPYLIPKKLLTFSEKMNEKNLKTKFDTKNKLKKEMKICVNQTRVDKYFFEKLNKAVKEIEYVKEKI